MPYCTLSLSCDLTQAQIVTLTKQLDSVLKEVAKKPPASVMIHIIPNCHLTLDGKKNAAFFHVNAVGIDETLMEVLGAKFLDIIATLPGIERNSVFINFNISDPVNWFLRGATLKHWKKTWADEGKKGFSD